MQITVPGNKVETGKLKSMKVKHFFDCTKPIFQGGYSGVLVQNRSLSLMGTILESDNSYVGTLGRRIPVEFYAFKKFVNLVDVLSYMVKVE